MNALAYVPSSIKRLVPASIKSRMRQLFGGSPSRPATLRKWDINPRRLPWFDQPHALESLAQRRRKGKLSDEDYHRLHQWVTDGYCIASGLVSHALIDAMTVDLDRIWTADRPFEGLEIDGLRFGPNTSRAKVSHREVLALEASDRAAARDSSNWRVQSFQKYSANAKAIFYSAELMRLASLILGRPSGPEGAINFMYGSTQTEHQDTAVFHLFPPNYIVGAWIACEDISPDSGPLMFYPRSHREPLFHGFDNYPQTNLKTASPELTQAYYEYVATLTHKFDRHLLLAKKGDALLWHGMLLHGGSEIKNPKLTRKSFVIHYIPPGMNVGHQVVGPFNW